MNNDEGLIAKFPEEVEEWLKAVTGKRLGIYEYCKRKVRESWRTK